MLLLRNIQPDKADCSRQQDKQLRKKFKAEKSKEVCPKFGSY